MDHNLSVILTPANLTLSVELVAALTASSSAFSAAVNSSESFETTTRGEEEGWGGQAESFYRCQTNPFLVMDPPGGAYSEKAEPSQVRANFMLR